MRAGKIIYWAPLAILILAGCSVGEAKDHKHLERMTEAQLLQLAEGGDVNAQFFLGNGYIYGNLPLKEDIEKGKYWLKRVEESGKAPDQALVQPISLETQIYWIEKNARSGDVASMMRMAYGYSHNDYPFETDNKKAAYWYRKAAERGNAEAQYYASMSYANGWDGKTDDRKVVKWMKASADQDYLPAIEQMAKFAYYGVAYRGTDGKGYVGDIKLARFYAEKAVAQGSDKLLIFLAGLLTFYGPVDHDHPRAKAIYELAIKKGQVCANAGLSTIYAMGLGEPPNFEKAVTYATIAADHGCVEGYYGLGAAYSKGAGVEQSWEKAFYWQYKAAKLGKVHAITALAYFYNNGRSVPVDKVKAYGWAAIGAEHGDANAAELVYKLEQQLPAAEKAKARLEARREITADKIFWDSFEPN